MNKLDTIDRKILNLLQEDAKMNIKEIAAKVKLTVSPTYERIKQLERDGFIKKYTIVLDLEKIGKSHEVICHVTLNQHSKEAISGFEKKIIGIDEVMECYHVSGDSDYLLKVLVSDMNDYQDFIRNRLSVIPNVSNVQSAFVMTNVKGNGIVKL